MPHQDSSEHHLSDVASQPLDDRDTRVLDLLARAASARDPVPGGLVDRVRFAVALDEVHVEVAQIQRQGSRDLVGVRGDPTSAAETSTLTFTGDDFTATITVTPTGRREVRIDGWLTGDGQARVALRIPGETRRAAAPDGRFWFDDVPRGRVQLLVEDADGNVRMVTPAVDL